MKYDIKIDEYGTKRYYINEQLYREDGPAEGYPKEQYKDGQRHRENAPAIEYAVGYREWCLNNKCYGSVNDFTNKSWITFIKTLIFLNRLL